MEEKLELRRQMEASLEAHRVALREEAKNEIEARVREVEERLTPRDAITSLQCEKLQTRLAKMHSAELLTETELHKFEDLLVRLWCPSYHCHHFVVCLLSITPPS